MKTHWFQRILCGILSCVLVLGYIPAAAFASEENGLCEHHPQHTEQCGYCAAVEGHDCAHQHTDACYGPVTVCIHTHDGCGYVAAVEGQGCECQPDESGALVHTEGCGYIEAVEEVPCGHVCSEESGCITDALNCQHQHDGDCGYVEAVQESPCTFQCAECEKDSAAAMKLGDASTYSASSGACGDSLTWTLTDDGALTISGTGDMVDFGSIYDRPAPWYYEDMTILSVTIAPGVTGIGDGAFAACQCLSAISIPSSVTRIGRDAFAGCESLTSITIPADVTEIDDNTFFGCTDLRSVTIQGSVTRIGEAAFAGCESLTGITLPGTVVSIGGNAFSGCTGLTNLTLPAGLTGIADYTFYGCTSLSSIALPVGVTDIEEGAFCDCGNLKDVYYDGTEEQWNQITIGDENSALKNATIQYSSSDATTIDSGTCGENLTWTLDSNGTLTISGTGKMYDYEYNLDTPWRNYSDSVKSILLSPGITRIGRYAFKNCVNAVSVTIPDTVTSFGYGAFDSCLSLQSIFIPKNLVDFDNVSEPEFSSCTSLKEINIDPDHPYWCSIDGVLFSKDKKCLIEYPVGRSGYYECPDGVTEISNAFVNCKKLTGIKLPDSLESIYLSAFWRCSSLKTIEIPEKVTVIKSGTFYECNSLTKIYLPAGLSSISGGAFFGCDKLSDVYFGGTEEQWRRITIGEENSALKNATIHYSSSGITSADSGTCGENLSWSLSEDGTLTISGTGPMVDYPPDSNAPWYSWRDSISNLILEDGITTIGNHAFKDFTKISLVRIPYGVTEIGNLAFSNCTSLSDISIPNTVTNIELAAFSKCTSLESVTIPSYLNPIDEEIFFGCTNLQEINLSPSSTGKTNLKSVDGVLFNQEGTLLVQYPAGKMGAYTIPDGVTRLYGGAFAGSINLTSVTIPDTVSIIGLAVFCNCANLHEVRFTGDAPTMRDDSFYGVSAMVYYPSGNTTWTEEVRQNYGGTITWVPYSSSVDVPTLGTCGENLTWVLADDGTLTISGTGAMASYTNVSPDGTQGTPAPWYEIRERITKIVVEEGVTSIGTWAFYNCTKVTDISLPDSLTAIDSSAFFGCSSLPSIVIPAGITELENLAFAYCTGLTSISLPNGLQTIGYDAFRNCSRLSSVNLPGSVSVIDDSAFLNCTGLTSVTIPSSVSSIGRFAFFGCTALKAVTIPDTVMFISDYAFGFYGETKPYSRVDGFQITTPRASEAYFYAVENEIPCVTSGAFAPKYFDIGIAGEDLTVYKECGTSSAVLGTVKRGETVYPYMTSVMGDDTQWGLIMGMQTGSDAPVWGNYTAEQLADTSRKPVRGWVQLNYSQNEAVEILLKQGETILGNALDADMSEGSTLTLSAEVQPAAAPQTVTWSSSNTSVAVVDADGIVTLKKLGTTLITAKATDGTDVKKSVTLKVFYADTARSLTAKAENVPSIGLQPRQTAQMTVTGTAPIDAGKLSFSSSNVRIATVDENGVITGGTTPGTATITASVKGDPLKRKTTVKVKVIAMQAEELKLVAEVNGEKLSNLELSSSLNTRSYPLFVTAKDNRGDWLSTTNVRWTSTNTKVAKVTVSRDGSATLSIPQNASGQCVITAVSNDLLKMKAQLVVTVRDGIPKLGSSTITLNSCSAQGVALDLRENGGNTILSVALANAPAGLWLDSDTLMLYGTGMRNGTYRNVRLDVTCADNVVYSFNLRVKVQNKLPSVTVKQTSKFNLFCLDSTASLRITSSGQTILAVELADTDDFTLTYAGGTAILRYAENPAAKPDTKGTLLVYLEGYSAPVSKSISISTVNTAPKLRLTPTSAKVRQSAPVATVQVKDATGNPVDPQYITCTPNFADVTKGEDALTLTLTKKNSRGIYTGGTAYLQVQLPTWTKPVTLKFKISVNSRG